jgi:hypothetical protein
MSGAGGEPPIVARARQRAKAGRDHRLEAAYDLGRRGEEAPDWIRGELSYEWSYESGVRDREAALAGRPNTRAERIRTADELIAATRPTTPPPSSSPPEAPGGSSSPGVVVSAGGNIGSAILGAFAYALMVNILKGTGREWLKAKWTNGDGKLP